MPKYLVHCDTGFCGVNEDVIVKADSESEAEDIASEWWMEQVMPHANVTQEADEEDIDSYAQIN